MMSAIDGHMLTVRTLPFIEVQIDTLLVAMALATYPYASSTVGMVFSKKN